MLAPAIPMGCRARSSHSETLHIFATMSARLWGMGHLCYVMLCDERSIVWRTQKLCSSDDVVGCDAL